jgi:sterol desaturase/sphingolipid hydroxylase (fatty acid hydroxylase superfamily)
MHRTPFLWRWFHQMHHSAERMDAFSAFIFHPLDVVGFAFVGSFALGVIIGLQPEAALLTGTVGTFLAFFNHSNIRTPQWLGYIIQRPENHSLHHERGVHAFNYGDISLWDMVFGTFRNPKTWEGQTGFYDGASERIGEMLIGRDVSQPKVATQTAPRDSSPKPLSAAA